MLTITMRIGDGPRNSRRYPGIEMATRMAMATVEAVIGVGEKRLCFQRRPSDGAATTSEGRSLLS